MYQSNCAKKIHVKNTTELKLSKCNRFLLIDYLGKHFKIDKFSHITSLNVSLWDARPVVNPHLIMPIMVGELVSPR